MRRPSRRAPTCSCQRPDKPLTRARERFDRLVRRGTFALVLDFRILGPLEVRDGEDALHLGGAKQRGVLAILLLSANEVVSADRLVDKLWGGAPPEDAAMALQAHAWGL